MTAMNDNSIAGPGRKGGQDKLRISFSLNLRRYPQFSYLRDVDGRGAHPEELVRLALLGLKAEAEAENILRATRAAGLAALMQDTQKSTSSKSNNRKPQPIKTVVEIQNQEEIAEIESVNTIEIAKSLESDLPSVENVKRDSDIVNRKPNVDADADAASVISSSAVQTVRNMLA